MLLRVCVLFGIVAGLYASKVLISVKDAKLTACALALVPPVCADSTGTPESAAERKLPTYSTAVVQCSNVEIRSYDYQESPVCYNYKGGR